MENRLNIGDKYYRIVRKLPSTEYKYQLSSWRCDKFIIREYEVSKIEDGKIIGKSATTKDTIVKIPILPMRICSYTICQDCIDYNIDALSASDLYYNIEEFIFTKKEDALHAFNKITLYKQDELKTFNLANNTDCVYPYIGVEYEV